ncbi:MAG: oxidoreductase, partial [Mycobacteriaceae bacterium]|nr:oxidoreductase [Mycobacteriaceae bacterium]
MGNATVRVLTGLVSAGLALGIAELVAAPLTADSAPLHALGGVVIDHTPDGLREWAIATFGTHDKAALFAMMGVVAFAVATAAGLLERQRRPAGSALFAAFAAAGVLAAWSRTGATWTHTQPTLRGAPAGIATRRT